MTKQQHDGDSAAKCAAPREQAGPIVLHLDHTRMPGGAEIALRRLCDRATNWVPVLALPARSDDPDNSGALDVFGNQATTGVRVLEFGAPQKAGASSASFGQALSFAYSITVEAVRLRTSKAFRGADVIHANTSRAALYGAMACWGADKPLVVHLRDMVDAASLGRLGELLFRMIVLPRADGVIGNSKATLSTALPYLRRRTITDVIPSPSGIDSRPSNPPVSFRVRSVGMVARIDPWKGQDLLFRSFARVFKGSATNLFIAGSPAFGHQEYLTQLKRRAESLGIEQQVRFLGHIEDVPAFLSEMDICVHSSIRPEPLGQNVLQYLAAGRPTVAVDAGGPPEWVTDKKNGLLVEMGNEDALVAALDLLNRDFELRRSLSQGALTHRRIPTDAEVAERFGLLMCAVWRPTPEARR